MWVEYDYCVICNERYPHDEGHTCDPRKLKMIDAAMSSDRMVEPHRNLSQRLAEGFEMLSMSNDDWDED